MANVLLNCTNLSAPKALLRTFEKMHALERGDSLQVVATDPFFETMVTNWSTYSGYLLHKVIKNQSQLAAVIQK